MSNDVGESLDLAAESAGAKSAYSCRASKMQSKLFRIHLSSGPASIFFRQSRPYAVRQANKYTPCSVLSGIKHTVLVFLRSVVEYRLKCLRSAE